MKMDDVPDEIAVKGVKGRRFKSNRYYSGMDNEFVLEVTYRFSLKELHEADAARHYEIPELFVVRDEGGPME